MINTDWIITVKEQESGWLVNGDMSVPNDPANRHAASVLEWIGEGNVPEPEFTQEEEVDIAILGKQQEVSTQFETLEGGDLFSANANLQNYLDPSLIFTPKYLANVTAADVAIIFIGTLDDVATIHAYNAVTAPNWSN